jgi:hypothetical protein
VVEITPLFATPFAVAPVAGAAELNPALAALLRARADEQHRDHALPDDPRCFRGREDLFEWPDPAVLALKQALLGGACAAVMAANALSASEFDALGVQARARFVIVRPDGCLAATTVPMASWYVVYCVAAPPRPAARAESGVLRLYAVRQASMFMDAANWNLRPPFATGHHVWQPLAGQMAVFPGAIAHEVALNRTAEDLLLVAARLRFANAGQTTVPPW